MGQDKDSLLSEGQGKTKPETSHAKATAHDLPQVD